MDWLSIIIAVLVFVLPVIFENDKKKKRKKVAREPFPEAVEPEFEQQPEPVSEPEPEQPAPTAEPVPAPAPVIAPARIVPHPQPAVSPRPPEAAAPRKKRRFSARDMVIYSEIMHPKYLEDYKKK